MRLRWQVRRVVCDGSPEDNEKLNSILAEGWEPFAVTTAPNRAHVYHIRQRQQVPR